MVRVSSLGQDSISAIPGYYHTRWQFRVVNFYSTLHSSLRNVPCTPVQQRQLCKVARLWCKSQLRAGNGSRSWTSIATPPFARPWAIDNFTELVLPSFWFSLRRSKVQCLHYHFRLHLPSREIVKCFITLQGRLGRFGITIAARLLSSFIHLYHLLFLISMFTRRSYGCSRWVKKAHSSMSLVNVRHWEEIIFKCYKSCGQSEGVDFECAIYQRNTRREAPGMV